MICDQGFDHPDPEPEVVIEEAPDTEPVAEAVVEVARIEADRDVTIAKIEHRALDDELAAELAALRAEVEVLRAQVTPPEPEAAAVPVQVVEAPPEPAEPESAPPVVTEQPSTPEPAGKKRKSVWWG